MLYYHAAIQFLSGPVNVRTRLKSESFPDQDQCQSTGTLLMTVHPFMDVEPVSGASSSSGECSQISVSGRFLLQYGVATHGHWMDHCLQGIAGEVFSVQ